MKPEEKGKILVSACLVGFECRYDGRNNINDNIVELVKQGRAIPVCPEQLGGLATPRSPAEIKTEDGMTKVYDINGVDVTDMFSAGAVKTLELAELYGIKAAILKSRSPSCGCGKVYSGHFDGSLTDGDGITAKLLKDNGIDVICDDELNKGPV